jgi:hypothetical protein
MGAGEQRCGCRVLQNLGLMRAEICDWVTHLKIIELQIPRGQLLRHQDNLSRMH